MFVGYNVLSDQTELGDTAFGSPSPESGVCFGARIGYNIHPILALEGEMKVLPTNVEGAGAGNIFGFRAGGLVHLNLGANKALRPFGWAGFGAETLQISKKGQAGDANFVQQDTDFALLIGGGVKYHVMANLLLRLDLRYINMAAKEDATLGAQADTSTTATNFEVLFGLSWVLDPMARDSDQDGIVDDKDKCPDVAEDKDGFEDDDGCPEADNDKDGIPDNLDKCPNDAEDKDGFEDDDGCPDLDNDKDGIPDATDKCPDKAEDPDNFEDEDGCPELDNDKDGIPDSEDRCRNEFGIKAEQGCPVRDKDKDGIPDNVDKCPNQPETFNGIKDDDGCPEKTKSTVVITKSEIKILQKVYFEVSKAEIKKQSFELLNTVAAVLNSQPQITGIGVQGHTDDTGNDAANMKLSQARAESVMAYLIERGVSKDRLSAKGFGETSPVCTAVAELEKNKKKNKTALAACRDENRRVTFRITSVNGKEIEAGASAVIEKKETIHKIE